jgi:hypothetical protein
MRVVLEKKRINKCLTNRTMETGRTSPFKIFKKISSPEHVTIFEKKPFLPYNRSRMLTVALHMYLFVVVEDIS